MNWDGADFFAAAMLLLVAGLGFVLLVRSALLWRRALGALIILAAVVVWAELAVGFLSFG